MVISHPTSHHPQQSSAPDDIDPAGLIAAATAGDENAWTTLVRRFSPCLRAIARSYRLGAADVDDVVQECWVRLSTRLADLRDPAALPGWLATTAHRQSVSVIRSRLDTCDVDSLAGRFDDAIRPDELAARRDADARLRRALARLSARDEQLLSALATSDRPSYLRVSRLLGLPVGSIGPTRARALRRLRQAVEREGLSA